MNALQHAVFMAWKDYWHERLLSACAVLGLAAALTPLLVLLGVQYGIITALTDKLLQDPRTLEITPVGSGKYSPEWFAEMQKHPGVAFVMPQTRSIAATITLRAGSEAAMRQATVPVTATGPGDPLLARYSLASPNSPEGPSLSRSSEALPPEEEDRGLPPSFQNGASVPSGQEGRGGALPTTDPEDEASVPGIIIAASTAGKLGIAAGHMLDGYLERMRSGKRESLTVPLRVEAVLPPEAQDGDSAFVSLALLTAMEDYRDGRDVSLFPAVPEPGQRIYASFRLYAANMDQVEPLQRFFLSRHLEVYVRLAEIETVRSLDRAFTIVFALISGAAVFGFAAATASSSLAGVKRKSRSLGIIRLMGFSRAGMIFFPLLQALFTGVLGFALALALYAIVAFAINALFAASVPGGASVCTLPLHYGLGVFLSVLGLSALSSAGAALQATAIEPSEVIRDV